MGLLFSKSNKLHTEPKDSFEQPIRKFGQLNEIITRYEYIKEIKNISDIDTILEIVHNTNWDKIVLDRKPIPSAPPMPMPMPSAPPMPALIPTAIAIPIK